MLIKNKPVKLKVIFFSLVGMLFCANVYCLNLNIDAANILNNKDYSEKIETQSGAVFSRTDAGFLECRILFLNGISPYVSNSAILKIRPLCFDGVAVAYSGLRKSPLYIYEILNKSERPKKHRINLPNSLFFDTRLPKNERASPGDFFNNLFEIDSDHKVNNGIPMAPAVLRKTWAIYEEHVAKNVNQASGNVYVITGSVFTPTACGLLTVSRQLLESNYDYVPWGAAKIVEKSSKVHGMPSRYSLGSCTIGNGVVVPSFIYRLVYDPAAGRVWVYWIENTNTEKINAPISYSELVRRTGINFFPGVEVF